MNENLQHRIRARLLKLAHLAALFIAMSIICVPGLWVVLNSFRPTVEIMAKPPVWIPGDLNLDNYRAMFGGIGQGGVPVLQYFTNSLIVAVTSTAIAILIGTKMFTLTLGAVKEYLNAVIIDDIRLN